MPVSNESLLNETVGLLDELRKSFFNPKITSDDLKLKIAPLLNKLKLNLNQLTFLVSETNITSSPDPKELVIARETLEIGALYALRIQDIPLFDRYTAQLKTYYSDNYTALIGSPSPRMYQMLGLNLLSLLAQNRIAEMHTELETIDPDQLTTNIYIRHPIQIEQYLMEGSYNKVWHSRSNVPAEEYTFFVDILMSTIRNEISDCMEKAYPSVPLPDAATLLYFKTQEEVVSFAKSRNWNMNAQEKKIYFSVNDTDEKEIPAKKIIKDTLWYAQELERIV